MASCCSCWILLTFLLMDSSESLDELPVQVHLLNRHHVRRSVTPGGGGSSSSYEYHVQIREESDGRVLHDLRLKPVARSVFAAGFQYTELGVEAGGGRSIVRRWIPSREEVAAVEARMYTTEDGNTAVVSVEEEGGQLYLASAPNSNFLTPWKPSHAAGAPDLRHGTAGAKYVQIEPELAFILDHATVSAIGGDRTKKLEYAAINVNGMNGMFALTNNESLSIRCELVNVVEIRAESHQPFITNLKSIGGRHTAAAGPGGGPPIVTWDNEELLDEFKKWSFAADSILGHHDIATLVVGLQSDPIFLGGIADLAGACRRAPGRSQAVAIGMDADASFLGVGILAHEIAHALGSPHDGGIDGVAEEEGLVDTSACPFEDGYLMSYKRDVGAHAFRLSTCSVAAIRAYATSEHAGCLAPSNKTREALYSTKLEPGDAGNLNPAQICAKIGIYGNKGVAKYQTPDQQCRQTICEPLEPAAAAAAAIPPIIGSPTQPLRNAPCGDGGSPSGRCRNGWCVGQGPAVHDGDSLCKLLTRDQSSALDPESERAAMCAGEFKCTTTAAGEGVKTIQFAPLPGTPCDSKGAKICFSRACVEREGVADPNRDCVLQTGKDEAKRVPWKQQDAAGVQQAPCFKCEYGTESEVVGPPATCDSRAAGAANNLQDVCVSFTGEMESKPVAPAGGDRNLLCSQLRCTKPKGEGVPLPRTTPDGTICGPLRRCRHGKCVICGRGQ